MRDEEGQGEEDKYRTDGKERDEEAIERPLSVAVAGATDAAGEDDCGADEDVEFQHRHPEYKVEEELRVRGRDDHLCQMPTSLSNLIEPTLTL